jgi:arylsulfatase A-like enzyme
MWCKHSNFEQAVRSPLIVVMPGAKGAGGTAIGPVGFVDVFPTLCEAAGLPIPEVLQGKSLVSMLNDVDSSVRDMQLSQYPRNHEGAAYMGYSLRSKRYRYTAWVKHDAMLARTLPVASNWLEFYDYETDPDERVNRATDPAMREMIASFEAELNRQLQNIWSQPASEIARHALQK